MVLASSPALLITGSWDAPRLAGDRVRRHASRAALAGSVWLAVMLASLPQPGMALDLRLDGDRNDETVAGRERTSEYDRFAKREAERVLDRDRPLFSPTGIRIGNFVLYPTIGTNLSIDDNVLATDANRRTDLRTEMFASLKLQSHLPRHAIDLSLAGRVVEYLDHPDMGYAGGHARLGVSLHIDHAHTLSMSVLSSLDHEDRLDPFAPLNARQQVPIWRNRASIGLTRDAGRLYGTISATAEHQDFQDVRSTSGALLDQDARDTTVLSSELLAGYRFSPGFELRGKLRGVRQYNRGNEFFDGDAWGGDAMAGLAFQTNPLLRWQILAGYGFRDFDRASQASIGTMLLDGELQWLPTQRVTITLGAGRQILEAGGDTASGVVQTAARSRADIEVWHNVVLKLGAEIREEDYIGSTRRDVSMIGRAAIDYHVSPTWLLTLGFEHTNRDSNDPSSVLTRNVYSIGAKMRF